MKENEKLCQVIIDKELDTLLKDSLINRYMKYGWTEKIDIDSLNYNYVDWQTD